MWDYDLTESQVHELLKTGTDWDRRWMLARILESATYEDVWTYTNLAEVKLMFPRLQLKKPIQKAWELALNVWQ